MDQRPTDVTVDDTARAEPFADRADPEDTLLAEPVAGDHMRVDESHASANDSTVAPPPRPDEPNLPATASAPRSSAGARQGGLADSFAEPVALTGVAGDLVREGLLEADHATRLARMARHSDRTFFRCLADNANRRQLTSIYRWLRDRHGWELIESENQLMDTAGNLSWLKFGRCSEIGAVSLNRGAEPTHFAILDPFDIMLGDWLAKRFGRRFTSVLVLPAIFHSAMERLKNQIADEDAEENVLVIDLSPQEEQRIMSSIEAADVPLIVDYFLQRGFLDAASDIHIEPTEEFLLVRNRVDGVLHEDITLPMDKHPEISSRIKILSGMDVAEKRRPQDGRIGSLIRGNAIDVRVSTFPTIHGEKIVMRLLDRNALRPSPEDLGMTARDLRLLYEKLDAPFGLVMISGPTGSGKTTTLYSCLGRIDKTRRNVLTVEDPVEYRLKGVHQMQVNDRIGLSFASGLRTILRQDPDVIMVGECRDTETAAMAIQAALTGHIVFSTIHTNDAVGVITRLLDIGVDRFLVANSLTLAIAQRLVRKICDHCRMTKLGDELLSRLASEGITAERLAALGIEIAGEEEYEFGSGCKHCRDTGYHGRQAVFEVFEMTNTARAMIMRQDFNADQLRDHAHAETMTTLIQHGMSMIEDGVTTHEEVIRVLGESY